MITVPKAMISPVRRAVRAEGYEYRFELRSQGFVVRAIQLHGETGFKQLRQGAPVAAKHWATPGKQLVCQDAAWPSRHGWSLPVGFASRGFRQGT